VKNVDDGRAVTRITFKDILVACEGGNTKTSGSGTTAGGGLEVKDRKFDGNWEYGKVKGTFKGSGKISGTVSISTDAGPPFGNCTSGNQDYVVKD
jgi:hypothetical protein